MAYVSRSSSGDFLEIQPDLAKWGAGRDEIWEFGFSQESGGAGIHLGGFVLMSGPQKLYYFPIWTIWGSARAYFPILSYYLGVPPGFPIGPYWLLFPSPALGREQRFQGTLEPLAGAGCAAYLACF